MTLRVALVGASVPGTHEERSFSQLPSYTVACEGRVPLASVLTAAADLGVQDFPDLRIGQEGMWFYSTTTRPEEVLTADAWAARCLRAAVGVDESGVLVGDDWSHARLRVEQVQRATPAPAGSDADLLVILWEPEGVGGVDPDVHELVRFLVTHHVFDWAETSLTLGLAIRLLGDAAKEGITQLARTGQERRLRRVARTWHKRRVNHPAMLRLWIQAKDAWLAKDVATGLSISQTEAERLLTALGYEQAGHDIWWRQSASKKASKRLQHWLDDEW